MSITINGTTGISGVDGSSTTPAFQGTDTNTGLFYGTDIVGISTGGSERVRVDASGNVGIGTSSPTNYSGYKTLALSGSTGGVIDLMSGSTVVGELFNTATDVRLQNNTANPVQIWTNGSERMRIDSSGNVLVGTAAQQGLEKFGVVQSGNGQVGYLHSTDSSTFTNSVLLLRGNRNTTNATWSFLRCYNNADKLFIYDSGNVVNANNSYGAISDIKLKENIVDATPKLDKLNQVRVVNYNLIGEKHKQLGVIAQELEQIFPNMIDESPDLDKEGNELGTTTKSVKYSVFIPMLIKAIQEQQTIINDLKARVTALEASNV